jgi:hypothetical protein
MPMTGVDDLTRQANTLAEQLRRARDARGRSGTPDTGELAAMESRLTSLWAAIRAARVGGPPHDQDNRRARPKWG